jgi:hypothetical protein
MQRKACQGIQNCGHEVIPGIYIDIRQAEKDAMDRAYKLGKRHRVVTVEVEYKWKVKDRKPKGKT